MSRRKQARPSRAHLEEELVQGPLLINAVGNVNETREDHAEMSKITFTTLHFFGTRLAAETVFFQIQLARASI
ncbi:unnamed protein product [Xylocopa violacea]|uniref:Uncharacterized protein n=1 Tax=Xylocopa violacea TaxID=135666 RepID=A0ABP1P6Z3_XYLVO